MKKEGETMLEEKTTETLKEKKEDAKEMAELLKTIPQERKGEAMGLIRGFALGAKKKEVV